MNVLAILQAVEIIRKLAPAISEDDAKKIAPVIVHQSNNEPIYKSRVSLGAIASILSGSAMLLMQGQQVLEGGAFNVEQISLAVTAIGGGITTLWGRWVAKKPLGKN